MQTRLRIFSFSLVAAVLMSSFGIARVTHLCKMSVSHATMSACEKSDTHPCCENKTQGEGISQASCCTTVVQMFRADLQSLYKTPLRVSADQIVLVELFSKDFISGAEEQHSNAPLPESGPVLLSGQDIYTRHCTFLI